MDKPLTFQKVSQVSCALLLVPFLGASCATPSRSDAPKPSQSSSRAPGLGAEVEFREAQDLYSNKDYEGALSRLERFKASFPKSPLLPRANNLRGLCYLLLKRPSEAVEAFKEATSPNPKSRAFNQFVLYNLARAQAEAGQQTEAEQTLTQIEVNALDRDTTLKYRLLKADLLQKKGLNYEAAREAFSASLLVEKSKLPEFRPSLLSVLGRALPEITGSVLLENLQTDFVQSPVGDILLYRLVSYEKLAGNRPKAEEHLRALTSQFPESEYVAQANSMIGPPPEYPVDPNVIGILLPLKGKFAKFGARVLQSIQLALEIFDASGPDHPLTLAIENSGDEPEQSIQALDRLVSQHHAAAVIGPLLTKGIEQVSRRATELRVPLISFARQTGVPSEFVLSAGLTFQLQARELARHAVEYQGLKRFAILAPRDKIGEELAHEFWDAVEALGGQITDIEFYTPGETDFRQPVDKLSGRYFAEARQREFEELAKIREAQQIKKRTRKTEQFYSLKPIVDYQAVFIPDEAKATGQIFPTFSYRDIENIRFLGPAAWYSPEFLARSEGYGPRAFFVEGFFPQSQDATTKKFVEKYQAAFGQEPSSLDAVAYDAANVLEHAMNQAGNDRTRLEILDRLKSLRGFPGTTGRLTYRDGVFLRELKVLTVRDGKFAEAPK